MLDLIVYLAVFVVLAILVWWLLQQITLPEPLAKIVMIVFVVVCVVVLLGLMLSFTGHGSLLKLR